MKVLLVSDNHGDEQILQKIHRQFLGKVDAFFHCGDSNLRPTEPVMKNFQTVVGNTDWGIDYPRVITQQIDHQTITVTHGHLYHVNSSLTPLLLLSKETNADVVAYGHTHQLAVTVEDQRLFINPGSISQPRGQYANIGGTFAIVEVTMNEFLVQYYNRQLLPIPELKFKLQRR